MEWPELRDITEGNRISAPVSQRSNANVFRPIRGDGTLIAIGSAEPNRASLGRPNRRPGFSPARQTERPVFIAFRESGNQLVTVSADAVIRLWTLDDGSSNERLSHLTKATSGIEIDENGATVTLAPDRIEAEWNAAARDTRGGISIKRAVPMVARRKVSANLPRQIALAKCAGRAGS